MILGILTLSFLSVVFLVPSCRWLLIGKQSLSPREEKVCLLFSGFSRNLAALLVLLWVFGETLGLSAYLLTGVLSALLILRFFFQIIKQS